ncbi:MAG: hypothetical protein J1E57_11255 [Prevotella sp.]|nr:hypothetical protein [Prevotella sp.]
MNYNNPKRNNSTVFHRMMCAIVFTLFTWTYLYFFQADTLAVAQHVLSEGVTNYNSIVSSILITVILLVIQFFVYRLFRLDNACHVLTYLPSAAILAMITDINCNIDFEHDFLGWCIAMPIILVVSLVVMLVAKKLQSDDSNTPSHLFSRTMWVSMLLFVCMFSAVCAVSNTNAVFQYRVRAETCLINKDYEGALEIGKKSLETDSSLTMIRAYALARRGELGEKLFTYPINCSGNALIAMPIDSVQFAEGNISTPRFMRYPLKEYYKIFAACPAKQMKAMDFLRLLERRGKATPAVMHYMLAIDLVNRDLDAFANDFKRYYGDADSAYTSLPRHYKEALTLYRHQRTRPVVSYEDEVQEADYKDFQTLLHQYGEESERKLYTYEYYFGSYWYYYEFK